MCRTTFALFLSVSMLVLSLHSCRTAPVAPSARLEEEGLPQTAIYGMVMDHMATRSGGVPKVLVVGIDGLRRDCLGKAGLADLVARKMPGARLLDAYAGGQQPGRLQQTLTAPGFATILTGQWAGVHKVEGNLSAVKDPGVPSFLGAVLRLYPGSRTAILAAWEVIVEGCTKGDGPVYRYYPGKGYYSGDYAAKDPLVVAETEARIGEGYDVIFSVLDLVDHEGHRTGFSPENPHYVSAASRAFGMVEAMLDAISARPSRSAENWLVIITADHGGRGKVHGGQSPEERGIFILDWEAGRGGPR